MCMAHPVPVELGPWLGREPVGVSDGAEDDDGHCLSCIGQGGQTAASRGGDDVDRLVPYEWRELMMMTYRP